MLPLHYESILFQPSIIDSEVELGMSSKEEVADTVRGMKNGKAVGSGGSRGANAAMAFHSVWL